jgi:hypothetical protein
MVAPLLPLSRCAATPSGKPLPFSPVNLPEISDQIAGAKLLEEPGIPRASMAGSRPFAPDFEIGPGDSIYLCGSEEAVDKYNELFPMARSVPATSTASASSPSAESPA